MSKRRKHFRANIYRDSWSLDAAFYKWIRPRLKCYREFVNGWPDQIYPTFEDFTNDLDEKIVWLDYLYKHECTNELISEEDLAKVWNEALLDKHYPDWRERIKKAEQDNINKQNKPQAESTNEVQKMLDKIDIDWVRATKDDLITESLAEEFGEWFGKRYRCLWW